MSVTLEVFQEPISWLNDVAAANIELILVTLDVSHPPITWLNDVALINIESIVITFEVSQKFIFELKEIFSLKSSLILVTSVVHRLTFPFAICSDMVELSTTVYVIPSISAVSPTNPLGHLHVLFSK